MIGNVVVKSVASLGGTPTVAALVVGGLVIGGLGGAYGAGAFDSSPDPADGPTLAIYPCPASGDPLGQAPGGQRLLLTGRTADGGWLRIHFPIPGRTEGWVPATAIEPEGELASLPVATCDAEPEVGVPGPLPTLTVIGNFAPTPPPTPVPTPTPTPSPTPKPTPRPTPKPTPKPTPVDTSPPLLDRLEVHPGHQIWGPTDRCATDASTTIRIRILAQDTESGIKSVVLRYVGSDSKTYARQMAFNASHGKYQRTLDVNKDAALLPSPTSNGLLVSFWIVATNNAGLESAAISAEFIVYRCDR